MARAADAFAVVEVLAGGNREEENAVIEVLSGGNGEEEEEEAFAMPGPTICAWFGVEG
jgi:hypothetical protein